MIKALAPALGTGCRFASAVLAALLGSPLCFAAAAGALAPDDTVAQRGDATLTVGLVDARVAEMPDAIRSDYLDDPERMARMIDGMLLTLQLAAQAEKDGIQLPPAQAGGSELERVTALANAVMESVAPSVTDEQVQQIARERYQVNKKEYATPATYTLRHLKVSEGKYGGVAAKLVAENARRRAMEGEDFTAIIAELQDPDAPGEFNGDVPLTDLLRVDQVVRLSIAALKSQPGFTEVFEGGGGYNLIELVRSNPAVVPPFEDVRGQIMAAIKSEVAQQARTTYMKRFVLMETQMNDEVVQQLFSRYFTDAAPAIHPNPKPSSGT